jgi:rubrerythrin
MPRWRCTVCGYETPDNTPNPPNECPVCGASAEDFEAIQE